MPSHGRQRSRQDVFERLLALSPSVSESIDAAASMSWDREHDVVTLTTAHVRSAIGRLVRQELSRQQLEDWAELVHGRDEVALDDHARDLLTEFLFEASTPELTGESDAEWADKWFARLSRD